MSLVSDLFAAAAQLTEDTARVHAFINPVIRTANCSVTAMQHVNADTTDGPFTATLPASKAEGDEFYFTDFAGTWETDNLTIDGNGDNFVDDDGNEFDNLICDMPARFVVIFARGLLTVRSA